MIEYFIDRGLILDTNQPLEIACRHDNLKLVKFYLEQGLQVDGAILNHVLVNINLTLIKLFLEYHVDFSLCTTINKHNELI
jgi:ankyrin repeat protein